MLPTSFSFLKQKQMSVIVLNLFSSNYVSNMMNIPRVRSPEEIANERNRIRDQERETEREEIDTQMQMVEKEIKSNFSKGRCYIYVTSLFGETSDQLESLGYKAKKDPYNLFAFNLNAGNRWTISWPVSQ